MSHAHLLCTGPIGGAVSLGKNRVLVSVQGDGVTCYDVTTRAPVLAWALGSTDQDFSSAAIYDYATNLCFAAVRPRAAASASGKSSVLAWSADASNGTIAKLSQAIHLPDLHALFPVSHTPEGEEEEAAAAAAEDKMDAEVDGSGNALPGVLAVFAAGGAALCSGTDVVAEAEGGPGQHTVAACYQRNVLVTVHSDSRGSGAVSATVYRVQGAELQAEPAVELLPPTTGCRAVAAASTPERTAVLWSDGSVAVYLVPGDVRPLVPGPDFSGPSRRPAVHRRLAGFRLPASKAKAAATKKRGAASEPAAAAAGVAMAAMSERQVAVVGWATDSNGALVLRLVVLETNAACVQIAHDFSAQDVGMSAFDPSKPVQVDCLGSGTNQLAVTVGTAVLIVTCADLKPPTLANLLGALAVDKALAAMRADDSTGLGSAGTGLLRMPAPGGGAAGAAPGAPLLGSTVAVNPAALAAARVLHADDLAALCNPLGGAPRPMEGLMEAKQPVKRAQWLVEGEVTWRCTQEESSAAIEQEERRVWQAVQEPAAAALQSDAALQQLLEPLLGLCCSSGLELSPRLVCRLLMLAAEKEFWGAVAAILAAQHPGLLSDVPGLAAAAADAGQFTIMEQLLQCSAAKTPVAEAAALLRVLVSPASSEAAGQAREARHEAAKAATDAAAAAAQQAAQGPAEQQQQQQGEQPSQTQEGGSTPEQPLGRRRRRKAEDEAAAKQAEAAAAAAAAAGAQAAAAEGPGAGGQRGAAALPAAQLPLCEVLTKPGAREQAVATCCRAAVEGLSPSDSCLHPLVSLHHPQQILRDAMRSLTAEQAVQLLRYATAMLRNHLTLVGGCTVGWQPPLQLPAGVVLPPQGAVFSWANAILDAKTFQLSHEPEAVTLMAELRALVKQQLANTKPMLRLAGMIEQLLQQQQQHTQLMAKTAHYSVQWLDLRVRSPEEQTQQAASAVPPML
ncbi:hypothetical protein D9Q98_005020 [Chlorella vulgaris]|uniref:Uncharacterized protein n=1 Tax=Chlorella vulgaris TaxID=3077 RepID=A0A9D4TNB2_CHLVU|nr:hypothetical protein D9Q98_005020 [Chlorella vulgaris]